MLAPDPVLSVKGLTKTWRGKGRGAVVTALRDVSFAIAGGASLAIVGESGSGKTTAAMCVARLLRPDSGSIHMLGRDVLAADAAGERQIRRTFGIVLQNPLTALDPRVRIGQSVAEPLVVHEPQTRSGEALERALAELDRVGLDRAQAQCFPHELSGGQLQRAVIARALILRPRLVILDEPTSALDVSIQAQVLNLLCDLRDEMGLSYLFITHNLALVPILAGEVLVMNAGAVVERGPVQQVFEAPAHAYTRELLASIPDADAAPRAGPAAVRAVPAAGSPPAPFQSDSPR
jgi:oligopeptide transport system ATP-binding protein